MACGWVQIIGTNPFVKRFESARRYNSLKLKIMTQKYIKYLIKTWSGQENHKLMRVHRRVQYFINDDLHYSGIGRISNTDITNLWNEFNKIFPS